MIILFVLLIICCIFLMCRDIFLSEKLQEIVIERDSYKAICECYEREEMEQRNRQGFDREISE